MKLINWWKASINGSSPRNVSMTNTNWDVFNVLSSKAEATEWLRDPREDCITAMKSNTSYSPCKHVMKCQNQADIILMLLASGWYRPGFWHIMACSLGYAVWPHYNILPSKYMYSQWSPHNSPTRVSYGVSFVNSKSGMLPLSFNTLRPSDAYICVSELGHHSDNGLTPGRRQAIIWTNTGLFSFGLVWNFNWNSNIFMHLKMLSAKCHPFCLDLCYPIHLYCVILNHVTMGPHCSCWWMWDSKTLFVDF